MRARKIKALKTSKNGKFNRAWSLNGNFQELREKSPGTTVVDGTSRPCLGAKLTAGVTAAAGMEEAGCWSHWSGNQDVFCLGGAHDTDVRPSRGDGDVLLPHSTCVQLLR